TVWVDVFDGSAAEIAYVERATGLHVPTLTELNEIESSSRLRILEGTLYLSTPIVFHADPDQPFTTSVGFVLRNDLLITVRFVELKAFSTFAESIAKPGVARGSASGAFVGLLET